MTRYHHTAKKLGESVSRRSCGSPVGLHVGAHVWRLPASPVIV